MPATRISFRSQMREAAMTLLREYIDSADTKPRPQLYPGRPLKLFPPTMFPDRFVGRTEFVGDVLIRRTPTLLVTCVWGLFDSKDAVDQADRFIDGFEDWAADHYHAAGANTLIGAVAYQDDPNWIPDWVPPAEQKSYYATVLSLEGLALD